MKGDMIKVEVFKGIESVNRLEKGAIAKLNFYISNKFVIDKLKGVQ